MGIIITNDSKSNQRLPIGHRGKSHDITSQDLTWDWLIWFLNRHKDDGSIIILKRRKVHVCMVLLMADGLKREREPQCEEE